MLPLQTGFQGALPKQIAEFADLRLGLLKGRVRPVFAFARLAGVARMLGKRFLPRRACFFYPSYMMIFMVDGLTSPAQRMR